MASKEPDAPPDPSARRKVPHSFAASAFFGAPENRNRSGLEWTAPPSALDGSESPGEGFPFP